LTESGFTAGWSGGTADSDVGVVGDVTVVSSDEQHGIPPMMPIMTIPTLLIRFFIAKKINSAFSE